MYQEFINLQNRLDEIKKVEKKLNNYNLTYFAQKCKSKVMNEFHDLMSQYVKDGVEKNGKVEYIDNDGVKRIINYRFPKISGAIIFDESKTGEKTIILPESAMGGQVLPMLKQTNGVKSMIVPMTDLLNKELEKEEEEVTIWIATVRGCQHYFSKTRTTMDWMKLAKYHSHYNSSNLNEHNITIVVTSCNLSELGQWKVRIENTLAKKSNMIIYSLSSKKIKQKNEFNNVGEIIKSLDGKPEQLPDVLVICSHKKRFLDIGDLLDNAKKRPRIFYDNGKKKIVNFTYNLVFDECDENKNLGRLCRFFNKIKNKYKNQLRLVHLVTATATEAMMKKLKKIGVDYFKNADNTEGLELIQKMSYEEANKLWRTILDHHHISFNNDSNTVDYIKNVMNERIIDLNKPVVLFVPAQNYTSTHWAVSDFFRENYGMWTFVHNGKFKGFIPPHSVKTGEYWTSLTHRISLDDFISKHNMKKNIELRDVFRMWKQLYPESSLAITGYTTIKRGVTFNTNGFNFTHMILTTDHFKKLNEGIQLLGRGHGQKEYCNKMIVICPDEIYKISCDYVRAQMELSEELKENYTIDDFKSKNKSSSLVKAIIFRFKDQDFLSNKVFINKILPRLDLIKLKTLKEKRKDENYVYTKGDTLSKPRGPKKKR
jgi:hypothetical protein